MTEVCRGGQSSQVERRPLDGCNLTVLTESRFLNALTLEELGFSQRFLLHTHTQINSTSCSVLVLK